MEPLILAQEGIPVTVQLEQFAERVLSPVGIGVTAISFGLAVVLIALRKALPALFVTVLFVSTFQANPDPFVNTLIGPLQAFRYFSKPLAFALLVGAALLSFGSDRGWRRSPGGLASAALLAFQCFYLVQLSLFTGDGLLKGAFGVFTAFLSWRIFADQFGRGMQDVATARSMLQCFTFVATGFVTVNLLQIVTGLGGALVGSRLAGIAGNAQMMGGICTPLLIVNAFLAVTPDSPKLIRIASWANCGFLVVLILATGSRTAALATAVSGLIMFRSQVGKAVLLGTAVLVGLVVVSLFYEGITDLAAERLSSGADTRTEGWLRDMQAFYNSPIFGQFPFLQPGEVPSGVESVLVRTLASMGVVGLLVLLPVCFAVFNACMRAVALMRASPEHAPLCSLFLAGSAAILVFNTFDGYAFGLMTFPVLSMYAFFALGSFILEEAERVVSEGGAEWDSSPSAGAWTA